MFKLLTILAFTSLAPKPPVNYIQVAKTAQAKYQPTNKNYVVVIDYTKPIDQERLFLVDMNKEQIVLRSRVAHGVKSGGNIATDFSNEMNTKKTSLGAYITKDTYYGSFGYSLKVKGLDSTNSNAERRYIIFHSDKTMKTKWSWGCFATPDTINRKLIDLIKGGCLVYVQKF